MFALNFRTAFLLLTVVLGFSASAQANHRAGHSGPIDLRVVAVQDQHGVPIGAAIQSVPLFLTLHLIDTASGRLIRDVDLQVVHEKLFHLFSFDEGLLNYVHEHPEYVPSQAGNWRVKVTFRQAGKYKLWADITARGQNYVTSTEIVVLGNTSPNRTPTQLPPVWVGSDGISELGIIGADRLKAQQMAMLSLTFRRKDGTRPQITPYLGALAHVVISTLDGKNLIHAHPMQHGGQLMVHTTFPNAGDYRLFVQFIDGGVLRTVLLNVRVEK